jgi:Ion channel
VLLNPWLGQVVDPVKLPNGAYYRPTIDGYDQEISPFTSIAVSMYWVSHRGGASKCIDIRPSKVAFDRLRFPAQVIGTATNTGYGDLMPTSPAGRAVANIVMILGVILTGIASSHFHACSFTVL